MRLRLGAITYLMIDTFTSKTGIVEPITLDVPMILATMNATLILSGRQSLQWDRVSYLRSLILVALTWKWLFIGD